MKINMSEINKTREWEDAGVVLPKFNIEKIRENTYKNPKWIHFGAGNIFRGFPAAVAQQLLDSGDMDTGIIVAEGYDYEIIDKIYIPFDNLSLLVTLKSDGTTEKTLIASITESLKVDVNFDWARLKKIFANPSLQMASFTITEKGYSLKNSKGEYFPDIIADYENGAQNPVSYMGKIASLCYHRFLCGSLPLAMVSMDNCSHNGTMLYKAVLDFAVNWETKGKIEAGFVDYINNQEKISFPWSMIDKITPRPDETVKQMLFESGFEDCEPIITSKNTYIAPFVNAEAPQYLVIEDIFPNGKPALEKGKIIFTDKETVDMVEKMKVCTCLNPIHTSLAIFGCLLGYKLISEQMKNPVLAVLANKVGYDEGLPVVVDPKIINPKAFIDEVINVRLTNPFMPDAPQRIATDTSQKLGIRFGETIKAYCASGNLNVNDLVAIPLSIAGWCRYLLGIDDCGEIFNISSDPMLEEILPYLSGISLGTVTDISAALMPILSNEKIFGVDLYAVGLGERIEAYFSEFIKGKGAVLSTLEKYLM